MNRNLKTLIISLVLFTLLALTACSAAQPTSATSSTNNNTMAATATTSNNPSTSTTVAKLNLNTATESEILATIPNFPNRMVREFLEYRPYVSIQQFRREIGKYVGDAQVAEWEKYVYVPISINDSDSTTFQQIPGLDSTETDALSAARPFASNDAFLTKLSEYISAAELVVAKTYLGSN